MALKGHLILIDSDNDFLISELSRIASDINSVWIPSQTLKKYHSMLSQLAGQFQGGPIEPSTKFELLKNFFFRDRKFAFLASKPKIEKYLLPYVLLSRTGPDEMLVLVMLCFAKSVGLDLNLVRHDRRLILKLIHEGKSLFFDFQRQGQRLSKRDVMDLINEGCDCTVNYNNQDLLAKYLLLLKTQCLRERSFLNLYKVQTYLVQYQPFALNHLVDRARAAYAIGDLVKAAEDLGQYVSFHSDKVANNRYLKLLTKIRRERSLRKLPPFSSWL